MKARLRDGSGTRCYKFILEDTDRHGNARIYFRRRGQVMIRLRERPGTEAFEREYQQALHGELVPRSKQDTPAPIAQPGTMRWLCQRYYASAAFQSLGDSTRKVRRGILDAICMRSGTFRYGVMEPQHVAKLRDEVISAGIIPPIAEWKSLNSNL